MGVKQLVGNLRNVFHKVKKKGGFTATLYKDYILKPAPLYKTEYEVIEEAH